MRAASVATGRTTYGSRSSATLTVLGWSSPRRSTSWLRISAADAADVRARCAVCSRKYPGRICVIARPDTTRPTRATAEKASTRRTLRRVTSDRGAYGSKRAQRPAVVPSTSVFGEGIAHASHRPDVARVRRVGLDLVPDVADVNVDGSLVLLEGIVVVPHQLEQLGTGVDAA